MTMPRSRLEVAAVLVAALVATTSIVTTAQFVANTDERLAYAPRMVADAESYVRNARSMVASGDWIVTNDTYHSVGETLYVAAQLRLFGSVLAVKLGHVVLLAMTFACAAFAGRRALGSGFGASALVCALSSSILLARYCAVVQYEIVVHFLYALLLALASTERPRYFVLGLLIALAATFRIHFGFVLPFVMVDAFVAARSTTDDALRAVQYRRAALVAVGFALVAIPFNALYAARTDEPFFFQSLASGTGWLRRLHRNATGMMWPYPRGVSPRGVDFILHEPELYIRFLVHKTGYLFGLVPDVWFVESRFVRGASALTGISREWLRYVFGGLFGLLSVVGWWAVVVQWARAHFALRLAAIQVAAVLLPQWIVGSSTRVLVPIFVPLIMLQLFAAQRLFAWVSQRLGARREPESRVDERRSDERVQRV